MECLVYKETKNYGKKNCECRQEECLAVVFPSKAKGDDDDEGAEDE